MTIEYQHTDNYPDAKEIRTRVFMEEQGFQNEFDDIDNHPDMIHITAYEDGRLLGCARTFPSALEANLETAPGKWVFGRLAVLPEARKCGLGSKLLTESEAIAREAGAKEMHLHAQCVAQPFYEKNGYEAYGEIEMDEHVPHQWMRKTL